MAHIKVGGNWIIPDSIHARVSGTWRRMHQGWVKVLGVWKLSWQEEVVFVATNGMTNVVMADHFAPADWDNELVRKRFVIPTGAEIGATQGVYALTTSSFAAGAPGSFAGELIVDNYGTISGIGGTANSGVGGTAVQAQHGGRAGQKYVLNNYGTIRAGGGGGGKGGNGGSGSYVERDPSSGQRYSRAVPQYYWEHYYGHSNGGRLVYGYNNTAPNLRINLTFAQSATGTYTTGGWTYVKGKFQSQSVDSGDTSSTTYDYYDIYRQRTTSSSGGAGGNGGRGQGYDGAAGTGANGAAGGTNAGAGGKGGNGGAWGASGGTGNTGASGNVSAGTAGAAGGLAGFYLNGSAYITLNNFGTLLGRLN